MARQPPKWQRLGFATEYAYRRSRGDRSASGTTGAERVRRAKAGIPTPRRRGQWSEPTPRGTRDMQTRGRKTLVKALKQARRDGREVLIGAQGEIKDYHRRRPDDPWTWTARLVPEDALRVIGEEGGNVDAAITRILEGQSPGVSVGRIDEYLIKEFSE